MNTTNATATTEEHLICMHDIMNLHAYKSSLSSDIKRHANLDA